MIKKNIITSIASKGISAVLSLVFVPFYVKLLGAEAYGFIGVFALLQSIFMLADLGLSGTFARETARLSATEGGAIPTRDLCRTFEAIFFAIGLLIAVVIAISSRYIAVHWVNLEHITVAAASATVLLIGISIGLQFPFFIHQGGMQGLQRQTSINVLLIILAFLRGLGAVAVLMYVESSIQAFFLWQIVISVVQILVGHVLIWKSMPANPVPPRFRLGLIRPLWRFAAGTAGITLSGMVLTQADKFILVKMLPLREFGYYTLAGTIATVPGMIALPFSNAIYPRFTQLVATRNFSELTDLYHRCCQALAVPLISVSLILAFFSREIMLIWTGNAATAQSTYLLVTILVAGSTLMGLMLLPYALQLAFGWTKLGLYLNIIGIFTLIPLLAWLVSAYGTLGASSLSLALYTGQMIGMTHFMHRRILQNEKRKWYINDVARPLLGALIVVGIGRMLISGGQSKPLLLVSLAALLLITLFVSAMSANHVREMIYTKISSFRQVRRP